MISDTNSVDVDAEVAKLDGKKSLVVNDDGSTATREEIKPDKRAYHSEFLRTFTALEYHALLKDIDPVSAERAIQTVPEEYRTTKAADLKAVWLQSMLWEAHLGWDEFISMMVKARRDFKRQDTILEWTLGNLQSVFTQLLHERAVPAYNGRSAASGSKQSAKNGVLCTWLNGKLGVCKMRARCTMVHKCAICNSADHGKAHCPNKKGGK